MRGLRSASEAPEKIRRWAQYGHPSPPVPVLFEIAASQKCRRSFGQRHQTLRSEPRLTSRGASDRLRFSSHSRARSGLNVARQLVTEALCPMQNGQRG